MTEALDLAQIAYVYQGDEKWKNIFEHTLRSMSERGIFDRIEGGFFRYSQDWNMPNYEKTLDDNARLLQLTLISYHLTGDVFFAGVSRDILRYLEENLYLPGLKCWAGSQEADLAYYSLNLEERNEKGKPSVDRTVYVNKNALVVRSLLAAAVYLSEPRWHDLALGTLESIMQHCYQDERGMAHYLFEGDKEAGLGGCLKTR